MLMLRRCSCRRSSGRENGRRIERSRRSKRRRASAPPKRSSCCAVAHLQIIALVIGFAAVGAAIIEQQLNMAAAAAKGAGATDSITAFLAQVQLWTSIIGFVIQVWLTSKIHRYLGIGFALMILPVSLGIDRRR